MKRAEFKNFKWRIRIERCTTYFRNDAYTALKTQEKYADKKHISRS